MGALVWNPLATGLLTGRYRRGQPLPDSARNRRFPRQMSDERSLELIERLILVAKEAGLSLAHMSLALTMAYPGVTSAIIGPRCKATD